MDAAEIGRQIKKAYPEYSQYPDELLGQRYLLKNKSDQVFGATDPEKQLKQVEAQTQLEDIEQAGGGVTAKEVGAKRVLDQLFELYYGKPGEQSLALTEPGEWRLPAQLKALETKFKAGETNSIEERIYKYTRLLEANRIKLARAAGDVGNFNWQEQVAAGKGIPGPDAAPNEAAGLFKEGYKTFAGGKNPPRLDEELIKIQQEAQQVTPQPQAGLPTIPQTPPKKPDRGLIGGTPLADIFFPGMENIRKKQEKGQKANLGDVVAGLGDIATLVIPAAKVGALGKAGFAARSAFAGGVRGGTLPNIENLGERAKSAATGAVLGGIGGTILNPRSPIQLFGKLARKGTQDIKISTKPMLDAAKDYAKDVPVKSPLAQSIIEALKKRTEIALPEVEKKLGRWGALAYTKSEEPRAKAESQLINAVYGAARRQIAERAPLVSTARTLSDVSGKALRGLGKVFNPLTIGAGITGFAGYKLGERLFGGDR